MDLEAGDNMKYTAKKIKPGDLLEIDQVLWLDLTPEKTLADAWHM